MTSREKALTIGAVALAIAGLAFLLFDEDANLHSHSGSQPPGSINIRVLDEKTKQPVNDSWVLVKAPQPATGYTDSQGLVAIPLKGESDHKTQVTVSAPGYEQQSVEVRAGHSAELNQILIRPTGKAIVAAGNWKQVTGNPVLSGAGASFSPWHVTCSAEVPPGMAIAAKSDFNLTGDPERSCGVWAECRLKEAHPARVCWEFRVQGYSERPFPGQTKVRGLLRYQLIPAQESEQAQPKNGLVYIQFSGEEHRDEMSRLRSRFLERGISAPGVERIDRHFKPAVRYFRKDDLALAEEVAKIALAFLNSGRSHGIQKLHAELVPGYGSRSRPGTIELWLPLGSPEHAAKAH
jgi:hypothetical protein